MIDIQKLNDHICYFKVPYKDIFVSIYVLRTEKGVVLFDAAACDEDVDQWILPAMEQLGVKPDYIFISHNHTDHAGGLARAAALWPEAVILSGSAVLQEKFSQVHCPADGEKILDVLQVVHIPGHTEDSAALLDLRTNTLVSGDCLQSYGIYGSGAWYGAIILTAEHYGAIRKLRTMPIETIAAAHIYHPVGMISRGADAVAEKLDSCIGALERVRSMIEANPNADDAQVTALCNDGRLPTVATRVITAMRKAMQENSF